MEKLIL